MAKDNFKERVRKILADYPSTRNSDEELTIKYWEIHHDVTGDTINIRYMFGLPTHKDIARYRAVIQNDEGQYIPTVWAVAKARAWNEQVWRDKLGYNVYQPEAIKAKDKPVEKPKKDQPAEGQSQLLDVPPVKRRIEFN